MQEACTPFIVVYERDAVKALARIRASVRNILIAPLYLAHDGKSYAGIYGTKIGHPVHVSMLNSLTNIPSTYTEVRDETYLGEKAMAQIAKTLAARSTKAARTELTGRSLPARITTTALNVLDKTGGWLWNQVEKLRL